MSRSWVWWLPKTQPAPWRWTTTGSGRRAQDAHRHLAGRAAGHGGVLDVDEELLDRAGLDRIHGPAALVRAELKQVGRVGVGDGLGLRLEVDGVGHDCLDLRAAPAATAAAGRGWPDRARTAPPTCAQRPTSTGMGQVIVIGVRRSTLPASARAHRGSGAARWLGCCQGREGET
jgi:hypothetical protein